MLMWKTEAFKHPKSLEKSQQPILLSTGKMNYYPTFEILEPSVYFSKRIVNMF